MLARRLLAREMPVLALARSPIDLPGAESALFDATAPRAAELLARLLRPRDLVLYSAPLVKAGDDWMASAPLLAQALSSVARVVYLSTTGVYGSTQVVDETTPPAPRTLREKLRMEEEEALQGGPWSSLVLRPAAIYGPGRGVHVSMREGRHKLWRDGSNFVSRIHVDDLAAHAEAALLSEVTGAFPVADEDSCRAVEIARFCACLMGVAMPLSGQDLPGEDTRRADRRVDGSAIRRLLNVDLLYPSYRTGIPAALR
ncbi:MAG: hypothetical protein JJE04_16065 [Acidobacteriia bacterium]|nr:hypothetical protein [Terriglobia bacterium]